MSASNNRKLPLAGIRVIELGQLLAGPFAGSMLAYFRGRYHLRRWRMTLARQDIQRGDRVQTVARRYGYGSPEALSRAFSRQFDINPLALRREAAHT